MSIRKRLKIDVCDQSINHVNVRMIQPRSCDHQVWIESHRGGSKESVA